MGMLRGMFLAGTVAVSLSAAARAADVELAPANFDWSGFYVGGYGGAAWANSDIDGSVYNDPDEVPRYPTELIDAINEVNDFSLSKTIGTYGVQVGYNIQLDRLVLGIQGDFGGLDLDGSGNGSGVQGEGITERTMFKIHSIPIGC